jgi:hypothetical protein
MESIAQYNRRQDAKIKRAAIREAERYLANKAYSRAQNREHILCSLNAVLGGLLTVALILSVGGAQ